MALQPFKDLGVSQFLEIRLQEGWIRFVFKDDDKIPKRSHNLFSL